MAFLGQFLLKQPKCWCNLSLSLTSVSTQRFNRLFSSQTVSSNSIDTPLIQEATVAAESEAKGTEFRTFEDLFKRSPFVSLGDPKGKVVVGTIKRVVEDSLYIDFGWKFQCVCPRPTKGSGAFIRGRKVRLVIKELELATKFLGSDVEVTLNEADCVLLGLHNPRPTIDDSESMLGKEESPTMKGSSSQALKSDATMPSSDQKAETVQELFADLSKSVKEKEPKEKGSE